MSSIGNRIAQTPFEQNISALSGGGAILPTPMQNSMSSTPVTDSTCVIKGHLAMSTQMCCPGLVRDPLTGYCN
jgi:hypothetical protein